MNFREDTEKASSRIWVESAHVLRTCAAANDIPIEWRIGSRSSPPLGLDPKIMGCAMVEFAMGFKASRITCWAPGQETTVKFSDGVG